MKSDRFLVFVLAGIAVLVALAIVLFFVRNGSQVSYGDETTPEGALRNYIIAMQKEDVERAYSYLSDTTSGKPTLEEFQKNLESMQTAIGRTGVEIDAAKSIVGTVAKVPITIINNTGGFFGSSYETSQTITMYREKGNWKVSDPPYPYGYWDWYQGFKSG